MEEIWRYISGYDEMYMISNKGRILSARYGLKIMKLQDSRGYKRICLHKNGLPNYHSIHRLVANEFIPNPMGYPNINHIDFNKQNNSVSNLEWTTQEQNVKHSRKHGRYPKYFGEKHPRSKLTDLEIIEIRRSCLKLKDIANKYGITASYVWKIRKYQFRKIQ